MDSLFNVVTIFCILIFSVELVATSFAQDEYFLGFFFAMDLVSTITLILDLTWVSDAIFCKTAGTETSLKASRVARAGARANRTIRIIRLLRLVKLYKGYASGADLAKQPRVSPGEGDDREAAAEDSPEPQGSETRVGKKLLDMTTRHVVVLALVMLLGLPLFSPSWHGASEFRTSADLGLELIYERLRAWCLRPAGSALPWCLQGLEPGAAPERQASRAWYERALLAFLHAHHDALGFAWRLYWVGLNSTSLGSSGPRARALLGQLGRLNQEALLGARALPAEDLGAWDGRFTGASWHAPAAALPQAVKRRLTQPWGEQCGRHIGVNVQSAEDAHRADQSACSIDQELRCSEVAYYFPLGSTTWEEEQISMMFAFDSRGSTRFEATLSIIQTLFICLAVCLGSMVFSKDANEMLLDPIQRMIAKMEVIRNNPLEAIRLGDLEFTKEEFEQTQIKDRLAKMTTCSRIIYMFRHRRKMKEPMETLILERTIIKLGSLLAMGFGEAGVAIIGQNMQSGATAHVKAMVPGKRVDAAIGFCRIRHFVEATEVLRERVTILVNKVCEIVHGCVDDHHGAPNKNLGDAFLLIWRLTDASSGTKRRLPDMAVMSLIRIATEVGKSRELAVYRGHPGLLQRLPRFRVSLGFGLHCGWAIEGAIGSDFKIDASYLSPNVNVATRLEASTKHFGTWVLISHLVIDLCSPEMRSHCRQIDHVSIKGLKNPLRLFTVDLDCTKLGVQWKAPDRLIKNRFKLRQLREIRKLEMLADDYSVCGAFDTDWDLVSMRSMYSPQFFQRFATGYRNYEVGEWMAARDMLFTCHYRPKHNMGKCNVTCEAEWPEDGPTVRLLSFMKQTGFCAPKDWPGHRELS